MADGVTTLGGGWDQVPANTAEASLRDLIAAGTLTGEALVQELKNRGFGNRGPAYYPVSDGKGPFYALGNPHDYAALDVVNGAPQWDLLDFDPSQAVVQPPPPPPPPPAAPGLTQADLDAAVATIVARIATAQTAIQTQITNVVTQADATLKSLVPIAEAALPTLSGFLGKQP